MKTPKREDAVFPAATTTPATNRVLQTYELLEAILLKLPLKNLFVVQRVNTTWKELIGRSEGIRKKMFLLADGEAIRPTKNDGYWLHFAGPIQLNPALRVLCDEDHHFHRNDGCTCNPWSDDCVHSEWPHYKCDMRLGCAHIEDDAPGSMPPSFKVRLMSVPDERALSARNMLLTQPPITEIGFRDFDNQPSRGPVCSNGGVKLGDLVDRFASAVARHVVTCDGTWHHQPYQSCAEGLRMEHTEMDFVIDDYTMAFDSSDGEGGMSSNCRSCRFKEIIMPE